MDTPKAPSQKVYHCLKCQKVLTSRRGKIHHETQVQCHLPLCHEKHDHEPVFETFPSLEAAKAWIVSMEWDQSFVITETKPDYAMYRCRHRPPKQNSDSQLPKERITMTVSSYNCKAKLAICPWIACQCSEEDRRKSRVCQKQRRMFRLRGCRTHSHSLEVQAQRISRLMRDSLGTLLKAGVSKRDILKGYCNVGHSNENPGKVVTMQDLRNIEVCMKRKGNNSETEVEPEIIPIQNRNKPEIQLNQSQILEEIGHNLNKLDETDRQNFVKQLVQVNMEIKRKIKPLPENVQKETGLEMHDSNQMNRPKRGKRQ